MATDFGHNVEAKERKNPVLFPENPVSHDDTRIPSTLQRNHPEGYDPSKIDPTIPSLPEPSPS